ncbi:MAG: oxidoreductase [Gemmatimonadetes bacterium]|nr:oxidoreductase [Gemmatimonadota bacterium]
MIQQVVQSFRSGELSVAEVQPPSLRAGGVLVRTAASAISSGTEGSTFRTARRSLVGKAKERPDLVRQVLDTAAREGVGATIRKVRARLDTLKGLGYAAAGEVVVIGRGVEGIAAGDRVACAGVGYACHAEMNWVPRNLVARIPEGVPYEDAAFATLGAISLQGIHQAEIPFGGSVAVIGLGLIGQITARILQAGGFRVFGIDVSPVAVAEALRGGIDDAACGSGEEIATLVDAFTARRGVDAAIVTASTNSGVVVDLAGEIVRDRGVVSIVGGVRIDVPRSVSSVFYEKEARIVLSRSYGPGRYDPDYEERGFDYPIGYVRWTEGRNLDLFLDLLARGKVSLDGIVTHRFDVSQADEAFGLLSGDGDDERSLGIVLRYPERDDAAEASVATLPASREKSGGRARVVDRPVGLGLIGAGNFARGTLLPSLEGAGPHRIEAVTTSSGITAHAAQERFGIARAHGGPEELFADENVDAVMILTRHDSHAELATRAMAAGKQVFVEKPLALDRDQLQRVEEARLEHGGALMVGYNRRFSAAGAALATTLSKLHGPFQIDYRINAGPIARDHWYQDPEVGGGRIIGEGGHFVDLLIHVLGALPTKASAHALADRSERWLASDNVAASLSFDDGSVATLRYVSSGDKRYPKERIEVLGDGAVVVLEDLRRLEMHRGGKRTVQRFKSGKGHREELAAFVESVATGGLDPIPFGELVAASEATFAIVESAARGGVLVPIRG